MENDCRLPPWSDPAILAALKNSTPNVTEFVTALRATPLPPVRSDDEDSVVEIKQLVSSNKLSRVSNLSESRKPLKNVSQTRGKLRNLGG